METGDFEARETEAIDLSVLDELVDGNAKRAKSLALKFIESSRTDMEAIEEALARNNWARLRELGHHAKSPANMVGARGFALLCVELETFPAQGRAEQVREIVNRMGRVLERFKERVDEAWGELPPQAG